MSEHLDRPMRKCPFCGCRTNAFAPACCADAGKVSRASFDKVADELADLRAKLARAEADYAEIAHVVGIEHAVDGCMPEPGPLDVVLRAIRETRAKADRVIEAEVARDQALAAKARAEADAAAMRVALEHHWLCRHCDCSCGAVDESATAGAALLRELEAATRYLEALIPYMVFHGACGHHPDDCPGEDEECRINARLNEAQAAYDAARGAR